MLEKFLNFFLFLFVYFDLDIDTYLSETDSSNVPNFGHLPHQRVPNFGHTEESRIPLLALANVKECEALKLLGEQDHFLSPLLTLAEKFQFFQSGQS